MENRIHGEVDLGSKVLEMHAVFSHDILPMTAPHKKWAPFLEMRRHQLTLGDPAISRRPGGQLSIPIKGHLRRRSCVSLYTQEAETAAQTLWAFRALPPETNTCGTKGPTRCREQKEEEEAWPSPATLRIKQDTWSAQRLTLS